MTAGRPATGPAALGGTPAAEVDIDADLVAALVAAQHPDLLTARAGAVVEPLANGWDNALFLIRDAHADPAARRHRAAELIVRLPRRASAVELHRNEQRWLPLLAARLPVPIPVPLRIGVPSALFPWPWSIVPWFAGGPVEDFVGTGRDSTGTASGSRHGDAGADRAVDLAADPAVHLAADLGAVLAALHHPAPDDAPANPVRGGPLVERDEITRDRIARLAAVIADDSATAGWVASLAARWERCVAAAGWDGPPLWLHGDLHAHNIVVRDGRLAAVIDFGDLTSGDPATDLAVAWSVFPPGRRELLRSAADSADRPIDDAMWRRAEGWAITVGVALAHHSSDHPAMAAMARRMLT